MEKTLFECRFCNKRFKKVIKVSYVEVKCPKCGEYDVDVVDDSKPIRRNKS